MKKITWLRIALIFVIFLLFIIASVKFAPSSAVTSSSVASGSPLAVALQPVLPSQLSTSSQILLQPPLTNALARVTRNLSA